MKKRLELYIRKNQIERIKRIKWICATTYNRLQKENPTKDVAKMRLGFEMRLFYQIWEICDDCIKQNESVLKEREETIIRGLLNADKSGK